MEQKKDFKIPTRDDAFVTYTQCEHFRECLRKEDKEYREEFLQLLQEVKQMRLQMNMLFKVLTIITGIATSVLTAFLIGLI